MAKVFLICGKICSGKTVYAKRLCREKGAALLSVDEIMLALFGQYAGERHDEYTEKVQKYLFQKSVELVRNHISVVLDWGFWTREGRSAARQFYERQGIDAEFHGIRISGALWQKRVEQRNRAVAAGEAEAYLIDENLAAKFEKLFEEPEDGEIDVWVRD